MQALTIKSALPDRSISHFVHSFWMLENNTGKDIPSTILPNGMVDVMLTKTNSEKCEIVVRGIDTVPSRVTITSGTKMYSIGLKLLAVEYLLGDSVKDVLNIGRNISNDFWQFEESDMKNLKNFCNKATQKIKSVSVEGIHHPETKAPAIHKLLNGGKIMAFGGGKCFTVASKGDGSLSFYVSYKVDESRLKNINFADRVQVLAWFKKDFAEWDSVWHELFENTESTFMPIPIYCMPLDQTWQTLPNLTLLGDAAHLMPPYAGEGVNMAMLDALELSDCLCNEKYIDIQTAIASYENQMRERASVAARESLENGDKMHSALILLAIAITIICWVVY